MEDDSDYSKGDEAPQAGKPADTALKQQRMRAWFPILHPVWVIWTFVIISVAFIPTGFHLRSLSNKVVELKITYDAYGENLQCKIDKPNQGKKCSFVFNIPKDMDPPVLVYYEIDNFYQNHREYTTSRDDSQLLGSITQNSIDAKNCDPLNKLGDISLNPCGLIANTFFNDIISLRNKTDIDGEELTLLEEGIAWQSDLDFKFKQPDGFKYEKCSDCNNCLCESPEWSCTNAYTDGNGDCYRYFYPNDNTTQYLYETYPKIISPIEGVTNEHFVVWMRTAAFPKFRKLYGYIDKKVKANQRIVFDIESNWDVHKFKGSKTLVVTTTNMFGGRNGFFGGSFIIVGGISLVFACLFSVKQMFNPRRLADSKYLKFKPE